jgi:hypothetical protein
LAAEAATFRNGGFITQFFDWMQKKRHGLAANRKRLRPLLKRRGRDYHIFAC